MTTVDPTASDPMHVVQRPAHAPWQTGGLHDREWLLTDGLGGYACGNALEIPARRYHAWLCCLPETGGRRVRFLHGVDERLRIGGDEHVLTAAWWHSQTGPSVPAVDLQFHPHPLPTWVRRGPGFAIERSLAMPHGHRAVLARWRNLGTAPVRLLLRPLLACEDADQLLRERAVDAAVLAQGASWGFRPDGRLPPLWLSVEGVAAFVADPCWYRAFHLPIDALRGYDATADRWSPGVLELDLAPGAAAVAAFAVGAPIEEPVPLFRAELMRRLSRIEWANHDGDPLAARLRHGVDDFFYRDAHGRLGVLAGFPWFLEWGRDVFVALPGLTLAVGEQERCREVLLSALPFLRDGLLPNIYGSTPADSHYGSADAALWFSLAVQRLQDDGLGEQEIRAQFGGALVAIAEACLRGTGLGLRVDGEGLLWAGLPDLNATWMDARTARGPVTPRDGQPVEIAALWCSLLQHLGELHGEPWAARAARAGQAFVRRFWRPDPGCLFDRWTEGGGDARIRPNMVLAAALPRSPLRPQQRAAVVAIAERELVTARGLRTLSPADPDYRPRYGGGVEARDLAYHQGTVWPWLGGFYVEAALRAAPARQLPAERDRLLRWLHGFLPELQRCGIDHISEVFDGDPPHEPGGTFAQAWNTGELLRAVHLCRKGLPAPGRHRGRTRRAGGPS